MSRHLETFSLLFWPIFAVAVTGLFAWYTHVSEEHHQAFFNETRTYMQHETYQTAEETHDLCIEVNKLIDHNIKHHGATHLVPMNCDLIMPEGE